MIFWRLFFCCSFLDLVCLIFCSTFLSFFDTHPFSVGFSFTNFFFCSVFSFFSFFVYLFFYAYILYLISLFFLFFYFAFLFFLTFGFFFCFFLPFLMFFGFISSKNLSNLLKKYSKNCSVAESSSFKSIILYKILLLFGRNTSPKK